MLSSVYDVWGFVGLCCT